MQTLQVKTPSDPSTSDCFVGLMRLAQRQIGGEHKTIVIGDQVEAEALRQRGIQMLGSLGGFKNKSNTLSRRLGRLLDTVCISAKSTCIGWGWHSASVLSTLQINAETTAYVDEVDDCISFKNNTTGIIPTNWNVSQRLLAMGIDETVLAEPIVGVAPKSVVVDSKTVLELAGIPVDCCIVAIVGDVSSCEELLTVAMQMKSTGLAICFVLPPNYQHRANVMSVATEKGIADVIRCTPPELRTADIISAASCIWAPSVAKFATSCAVLDVVDAAWDGIPILAGTNHPIASIPTVGKLIACAGSYNAICSWIIGVVKNEKTITKKSADTTMAIRSIASPSRFIEGLLLRTTSPRSCTRC